VKSRASTVRAASSQTSSRHIYISYIEFIVLIHINSYTKFIVLIHISTMNFAGMQHLSSMSTLISWHIGRQRYSKDDPANTISKRYLWKTTALWSVFCTAQTMVPPLQAEKRLTCGMSNGTWTHSESILTQTAVPQQFAAPSAAQLQQTWNTLQSHIVLICNFFGQILTRRQDLAKVLKWVC
jgi:hypothetical protein